MDYKYKLICLDLDGTLLTSDGHMDEDTLMYLRRLIDKGIMVSIATGRPAGDAIHHAELISDQTFYICSNGAAAGRTTEEGYFYEDTFGAEEIRELMAVAGALKINPIIYTSDKILISGIRDYFMHRFLMARDNPILKKRLRFLPGRHSLMRHMRSHGSSLQKAVFFIPSMEKQRRVDQLLPNERFEKALTFNICYEISAKGVNKSHGIKQLTKHLGISADEVVAFGDSENDREMLKYVGMGIAMGNAEPHIKKAADTVTATNDEKGVLVKLQELFTID